MWDDRPTAPGVLESLAPVECARSLDLESASIAVGHYPLGPFDAQGGRMRLCHAPIATRSEGFRDALPDRVMTASDARYDVRHLVGEGLAHLFGIDEHAFMNLNVSAVRAVCDRLAESRSESAVPKHRDVMDVSRDVFGRYSEPFARL
jgi:hypothetical protein